MSSTYIRTNSCFSSPIIKSIALAKCDGAFINRNGITSNSYNPSGLWKAVFFLSFSFKGSCQNPEVASHVLNMVAPRRDRRASSALCIGYAILTVCSFSFLASKHTLHDTPSGFLTASSGLAQALEDFRIKFNFNNLLTALFDFSLSIIWSMTTSFWYLSHNFSYFCCFSFRRSCHVGPCR